MANNIFLLVSTNAKANNADFRVRLALLNTTPNYYILPTVQGWANCLTSLYPFLSCSENQMNLLK